MFAIYAINYELKINRTASYRFASRTVVVGSHRKASGHFGSCRLTSGCVDREFLRTIRKYQKPFMLQYNNVNWWDYEIKLIKCNFIDRFYSDNYRYRKAGKHRRNINCEKAELRFRYRIRRTVAVASSYTRTIVRVPVLFFVFISERFHFINFNKIFAVIRKNR